MDSRAIVCNIITLLASVSATHWHAHRVDSAVREQYFLTTPWSGMTSWCPSQCHCQFDETKRKLDLKCDGPYNATVMSDFFSAHKSLEYLRYYDSILGTVPKELCLLTGLRELQLNNDSIFKLEMNQFSCMESLQRIDLDHNAIQEIGNYSFAGCENLVYLSMRYNGLQTVHSGAFLHKELTNLFELRFEYNSLTEQDFWPFLLPSLPFSSLSRGVFLNITFNKIYRLVNTVGLDINKLPYFKTLAESLVIDFRRNELRKIANVNFVKLLNITHYLELLKFWNMAFIFTENPWDCDCDMYYLLQEWRPLLQKFSNWGDRALLEFKCASPPRASGTVIINTTLTNFQCRVNESCPDKCVCWHTPGNATMNVHCTGQGLTRVPNTSPNETNINLHLAGNSIPVLEKQSYFSNVSLIDVSMCGLKTFEKGVFIALSGIKSFYLNDNNIRHFPVEMFRAKFPNLTEIHLYNNPVKCSCQTLYLKSWVTKHGKAVIHPDGIECHEGGNCPGVNILDVHNADFICGIQMTFIFEIFSGCLGFVIFNALLISVYRRNLQIRIYCAFKKKIAMPMVSANQRHTLDVLSIGVEENQREVSEIMEYVRNILPEPRIFNNIDDVVLGGNTRRETCSLLKETRCIILNISRDFLSDKTNSFLFSAAFDAFIQDRDMALLPVLIDVSRKEDILGYNIESDFKYFIRKADCLLFNDRRQFEIDLRNWFRNCGMI